MEFPPRPLTPSAFDLLWKHISEYHESTTMNNRMRQMASAFELLLGQSTLWVWHTDADVFPAMSIQTSEGVRWGLPSGKVVNAESDVLLEMKQYLGAENITCIPGKTVETFRRRLPAPLSEGHWNKNSFEWLGVGVLMEATISPDQIDQDALVEMLAGFSCHPYLGRRIVQDLINTGERITTVMSLFAKHLPKVVEALAPMGVRVSRTWAKPGAGHSNLPPGVDPSYGAHLPKMSSFVKRV